MSAGKGVNSARVIYAVEGRFKASNSQWKALDGNFSTRRKIVSSYKEWLIKVNGDVAEYRIVRYLPSEG